MDNYENYDDDCGDNYGDNYGQDDVAAQLQLPFPTEDRVPDDSDNNDTSESVFKKFSKIF